MSGIYSDFTVRYSFEDGKYTQKTIRETDGYVPITLRNLNVENLCMEWFGIDIQEYGECRMFVEENYPEISPRELLRFVE